MSSEIADRRVDLTLEPAFRLGVMAIDPAVREVSSGDRREVLTPRALQVLVRLARTPGEIVTRDQLTTACWDGRIVGENAIDQCITRLRKLAEPDGDAAFSIETVPRVGYRLWPGKAEAEPPPPPPPPEEPPDKDGLTKPERWRRLWPVAAVVAGVMVAGSAAVYAGGSLLKPAEAVTLAVLPFQDYSPGRDKAYFAEGVAEDIQSALAQQDSITVIGRTSARAFKDSTDMAAIRATLRVTHVLEGSVRTQGGTLRMNVRLVQARDGAQVWAETFEEPARDVFAAQDQISARVARALHGRFASGLEEPAQLQRTGVQAYDLVLAARARLRERRPADLKAALTLLQRAVRLDPQYGPAWAGLAEATMANADSVSAAGDIPLSQARADARRFAQRAVRLSPERAEGYSALALTTDKDQALANARKAVALDGSSAEHRIRLAEALELAGDYQAAAKQLRTATLTDPLHDTPHTWLAYLNAQLGNFAEAEGVVSDFERLRHRPVETNMTRAYISYQKGDWSKVIFYAEKAQGYPNAYFRADLLGRAYRLLGFAGRANGLSALTPKQFEVKIWADDDRGALAELKSLGDVVWEDSTRAWFAAELLARAGDHTSVVRMYDSKFRTPSDYCANEDFGTAMPLAHALQVSGREAEARVILKCDEDALLHARKEGLERGRVAFSLSQNAAMRGSRDEAVRWLETSYAEGYRNELYADLRDRIAFRRLDGDAGFETLRRKFADSARTERVEALRESPTGSL